MMQVSEDVKINLTKLDSYFSFMRGAKSANSKLFKDFCNEAEMEKNSQIVGFILTSSLSNNSPTATIIVPNSYNYDSNALIVTECLKKGIPT